MGGVIWDLVPKGLSDVSSLVKSLSLVAALQKGGLKTGRDHRVPGGAAMLAT